MDPVSAFSVASNVIAFVDFSCKLVSQSRQIYKSANGMLSDKIFIESLAQDLVSLTTNLQKSLQEKAPRAIDTFEESYSEDDLALEDLCRRCQNISELLIVSLNKLKLREGSTHRNWESFKKALRATWSHEEVKILADQLAEVRSEIEFRVLVTFRGTIKTIAARQTQASHQLTESTQSIINTFLSVRDEFATELQRQSEKMAYVQGYQDRAGLEKHGTFQTLAHQDEVSEERSPEAHTSATGTWVEQEMVLLMIENAILRSLDFASIRDRHEDLELAHNQTFEWIYRIASVKDRGWSNFMDWLEHDDGLYWINGKAGSGKSTLMKYIYNHSRTRQGVESWAGLSSFNISGFFFWNSGTDEQRSQRGLLRTLLFETLQTHRELLPKVFPNAWDAWSVRVKWAMRLGTAPSRASLLTQEMKVWTLSQLKHSFRILVDECRRRRIKLCFFIDGLDEYEGDHDDIADYFLGFAHEPGLKICLSSRPLVVFEEAFNNFPRLKLQYLTHGDISQYVKDKLANHKHMAALSLRSPDQAGRLVREIVDKADGVFLWVKLVVKSLLQGLRDKNRISDLQKRLRHLPADLEALYTHMLESTDPFYLEQASKIFQIVFVAQKESTNHQMMLLQLSWAEDEDEDLAVNTPLRVLTNEEISARCKLMDSRLKSVCSGLLESYDSKYSSITPDARVVCLHRTVSEFFKKPAVWSDITQHTQGTRFCPHLCLLRSSILQIKALKCNRHTPLDMTLIRDALGYAQRAEIDLNVGFPVLLDQLDASAARQWRISDGRGVCGRVGIAPVNKSFSGHRSSLRSAGKEQETGSEDESDHYFDCRSSNEFPRAPGRNQNERQIVIGPLPPQVSGGLSHRFTDDVNSLRRINIEIGNGTRELNFDKFEVAVADFTHWTYGIEFKNLKPYQQVMPFYDLAKCLGLRHYIAHKDRTGLVVDHDVNHYLLVHAVTAYSRPKVSGESQIPDLGIVQKALDAGADLNFSYHGESPWEEVLAGTLSHLSKYEFEEELWDPHNFRSEQWIADARTWARIMKMLLEHGADPVALSKQYYGQPRRKVFAIIQKFPDSLTSEAAELCALLNKATQKTSSNVKESTVTPTSTQPSAAEMIDSMTALNEKVGGESIAKTRVTTYSWMVSWFSGRSNRHPVGN